MDYLQGISEWSYNLTLDLENFCYKQYISEVFLDGFVDQAFDAPTGSFMWLQNTIIDGMGIPGLK